MDWGEVNPVHAYYNGSCTSKDNEDPSWSTSFKTRRTQKTSAALEAEVAVAVEMDGDGYWLGGWLPPSNHEATTNNPKIRPAVVVEVECAWIIGIKHRHNVVRDILVDICYRSGISTGMEVDIGLDGGRDKPLSPADMLLYSLDEGLDVCVDLTGSSPLTQTGMIDFVPGRAVINVAQRKRGKYMAKCAAIGYGFLPFSFSSLGELEVDAVTLLKRI
ncbi:hypothetical protein Tco_0795024 [Tanacetum coccineum]